MYPMISIKGYVEAMADGTIPPEMQGKYLNIILFETERLTDLTRDLLTLNEFDTKDLLLNKTDFDIHEVIRNTAASFEGTCTAKKISIELLLATRTLYVHASKIMELAFRNQVSTKYGNVFTKAISPAEKTKKEPDLGFRS